MIRPRLAAALLLSTLVTGCGFHLRRPPELPPQMRSLYIVSAGHNADLIRELRRDLESGATKLTEDPTQAGATLSIINVIHTSRPLVLDRLGQPLEYQVAYTVEYTLLAGQVVLIPPEYRTLTRNYNYNAANTIGDQEQEQMLYGALTKDMAQLIMFRLQAVAKSLPPVPATSPSPTNVTRSGPALVPPATRAAPAAASGVPPAVTRAPPMVD